MGSATFECRSCGAETPNGDGMGIVAMREDRVIAEEPDLCEECGSQAIKAVQMVVEDRTVDAGMSREPGSYSFLREEFTSESQTEGDDVSK